MREGLIAPIGYSTIIHRSLKIANRCYNLTVLTLVGVFLHQGLDPSLDRSSNRTNLYQPSTEENKACDIPIVLSLEECLYLG